MFTSMQPMLQEKRINAFLRMKLEVILTVYEVSNY